MVLIKEPNGGGASLLETLGSLPGAAEPPGASSMVVCSFTHALSPVSWHNAASVHRATARNSPVELTFPVRMLLNMLFITLYSVCPCNEVPWEGVLSRRGRGKNYVFILWILTHVTVTIFLFKLAARMPRDRFVAQLSQLYRLFQVCVLTSLLASF